LCVSVGKETSDRWLERRAADLPCLRWSEEEEEREAQAMHMLGYRHIVGIKTEAASTGKTRRATTSTRQKEIPTLVWHACICSRQAQNFSFREREGGRRTPASLSLLGFLFHFAFLKPSQTMHFATQRSTVQKHRHFCGGRGFGWSAKKGTRHAHSSWAGKEGGG